MNIPNKIKEIIADMSYSIDTIGMSNSQVICFDDMILKIEKQGEESDNELKMMAWLANKLPVPEILLSQSEDGINYLLMSKIKGEMACSTELLANPNQLVKLLANGLRMLWGVDISKCPCNNLIDNKLVLAEILVRDNLCDIENGFENPEKLLQWLKENRPNEELVFSHGDYCLPNIFIRDDQVNGFIDLGRSGVADIYQDIALCYRSLQHNFGGKHGGSKPEGFDAVVIFDELKIVSDWNKVKYYILLDELF